MSNSSEVADLPRFARACSLAYPVNTYWPDTFMAEYIALTQLQADAFVCMDPALARAIGNTVTVASLDDLLGSE